MGSVALCKFLKEASWAASVKTIYGDLLDTRKDDHPAVAQNNVYWLGAVRARGCVGVPAPEAKAVAGQEDCELVPLCFIE